MRSLLSKRKSRACPSGTAGTRPGLPLVPNSVFLSFLLLISEHIRIYINAFQQKVKNREFMASSELLALSLMTAGRILFY